MNPGLFTRQRTALLAMLMLTYMLNVVDRQLVSVLAMPIRAELQLTDTELGLLGGLAFALFYTTLAIPAAWLADRWSRSWTITLSLALWSAFTGLCGLAANFGQLFAARIGVGVGEAGGVAPAHALLSAHFPPKQRARAIGVYSMALPIGGAAGLYLGGWIASNWGWRAAFIVIGLIGLVIAPLARLVLRDEPEYAPAGAARPPAPAESLWRTSVMLMKRPELILLAFGAGFGSLITYGLTFWLPSYAARSLGLSLLEIGGWGSAITLVGGIIGIGLSSWISDRFGARNLSAYAAVPAVASLLAAPLYAAAIWNDNPVLALPLFLLPTILSVAWLGPVLSVVQNLVAPEVRATASALLLLVNNLLGFVGGTLLVGATSDALAPQFGDDSLRYALLANLFFYFISAALLFAAAKRLRAVPIAAA